MAESLGLSISESVASHLVQDAEYRLREIIHEATKFMKHSKRQKLMPQDINLALRVKNVEPLYGYDSNAPSEFKMIASGNNVLYYVADKELDLEEMIAGELPPIPLDVTLSAHWLSIEGVQPRVIQNPTPGDLLERDKRLVSNSSGTSSDKVTPKEHGALVKTILTQELQLYYNKITESLMANEEELRKNAIECIAQDPGIQGLLPYLVEFLSETIAKNTRNLRVMWTMMRLVRSILYNPDLFVEPYLHHLTPNILTCLLTKRLSDSPSVLGNDCRVFASQLMSHICLTYGDAYPTLVPRVTKTLLRAFLDPSKSLGCRYGAIVGLEGLGPSVTRAVVLPNVKAFGEEMTSLVKKEEVAHEASLCIQAMEKLLQSLFHSEMESRMKKGESREKAMDAMYHEWGPLLGLFEKVLNMNSMDVS